MKYIFAIWFLFSIVSVNSAQVLQGKMAGVKLSKRYSASDTIPRLITIKNQKSRTKVQWVLDGQEFDEANIHSINPKQIEEIRIEKDTSNVNEKNKQKGRIIINTKADYSPKLISLKQLKEKYLDNDDKQEPVLFIIDNKVIGTDYDQYFVDEKYLLKIEVQKVDNRKEGLDILVINLSSRTEENLKKMNTILIRGAENTETSTDIYTEKH